MLEAKNQKNSKVISHHITSSYIKLCTDNGYLKLEPYDDKIIRITYNEMDDFTTEKTLGVIGDNQNPKWHVEESLTSFILHTKAVHVMISKETCALSFRDVNGNDLLKEPKFDGKALDPFDSYKTILDDSAIIKRVDSADGVKETIINANKVFDQKLYHGRLTFEWQDDEALYGLGQQEEGTLNLRGTVQYVHQENKKTAVPFLLSSKLYGLLLDTYSPIIFSDNEYGSYLYSEAVESLDYYFIHGHNFDEIISGYRQLTGQATMLPKWVFGYMQSFERYESAAELIDTVQEHHNRAIPIDSIVLDWQSWEENQWGQKSFDQGRFGKPSSMIDQLHDLNVHFMISLWPNMHECTDNSKEFKEKGGLFQRSDLYNAFDPSARDLYWSQTKEGLFDHGIDAWWTDASEPFTPAWLSERPYEPSQLLMNFHNMAKTYIKETHTNAYPLVHGQTIYEGQRSVTNDKRVVNLTRSGYTGQQRYGNILWSGDLTAKWSTLKKQIAAGLNLCASGIPYWTLDIGGFFVKRSTAWYWNGDYDLGNQDPAYRELYTRWFQFATFLPILRAHGTDTRREVWQFGEPGTIYYDTIVNFIKLRYRLIPYIYSLAGMVTQKDLTILRLLAFDYNNDPAVHEINDQYMFGDAFMVCPIVESAEERYAYLPKGSDWYDFWTGHKYSGGMTTLAKAPIDRIPLFVKSGAIIPMAKEAQNTKQILEYIIDLHIYTGSDGTFTLYLDSNDGYGYENDEFATIDMTWHDDSATLTLSKRTGSYMAMPLNITFNIFVNGCSSSSHVYNGAYTEITL